MTGAAYNRFGKSARQPLGEDESLSREESPGFTEQDAG